ncbi:MAG: hypothetical protein L0H84_05860 [Pseudonocardia sp.]|nr:hypothetical protein [Pseudonocardia sp.]
MEPGAVAELARRENDLWQRGDAEPSRVIEPGPGAYMPLDGRFRETGELQQVIQYLGSTAIGTVLIIRFRWPLDDADRDLLLPTDLRDYSLAMSSRSPTGQRSFGPPASQGRLTEPEHDAVHKLSTRVHLHVAGLAR